MIPANLQALFDSVRRGDAAAADRMRFLLRPIVSRAVRKAVTHEALKTPLERHVEALLADAGLLDAPASPGSLEDITRAICTETVAQLQRPGGAAQAALETVLI